MPSPNTVVLNRDESLGGEAADASAPDLRSVGYHYVNLGPKPGAPEWDPTSKTARHPFPSWRSAMAFAKAHKDIDPDREVIIDLPDGRRWDGKEWIA